MSQNELSASAVKLRFTFRAASLAAILFGPSWIVQHKQWWLLGVGDLSLVAALAAMYVACIAVRGLLGRRGTAASPTLAFGLIAVGLSVSYLIVLLFGEEYSRALLILNTALYVGAFLIELLPDVWFARAAIVGMPLLALGGGALAYHGHGRSDSGTLAAAAPKTRAIAASQHLLSAVYFKPTLAPSEFQPRERGGAIARLPKSLGYALATSAGELYAFHWDEAGKLIMSSIDATVPINVGEFLSANPQLAGSSFRVAGLAVRETSNGIRMLVSHHHWNSNDRCVVFRVSELMLSYSNELLSPTGNWRTVFESTPCLPMVLSRGTTFAGEQIGGRIVFVNDTTVLISVGDHQFDGWYKPLNLIQDSQASYGKIVQLDLATGTFRMFGMGFRNPQGLTIAPDGQIWETEHGPQGGDELNKVVEGGNYGYPYVTLGTDYRSVTWPMADTVPAGSKFIDPVFSWVPSIGISDLISIKDPAFSRWRGDLLIGSLRGQALWRVRLLRDRVVYTEPIPLGERVRAIVDGPGEIVVWTDSDSLIRIRPDSGLGDSAALVSVNCSGCHHPEESRIGPPIGKVLGHDVASVSGYPYSEALRSISGKWTAERLDKFLADPAGFAPGNRMTMEGIKDAGSRRAIIDYLSR